MNGKRKASSSNSILSYFKKSNSTHSNTDLSPDSEKQQYNININQTSISRASSITTDNFESQTSSIQVNALQPTFNNDNTNVALPFAILKTYDIGLYTRMHTAVDDFTRFNLLKNHWVAPINYKYPFSLQNYKGKEIRRYLNQKHLDCFSWAVYSESQKGLFCKYCSLFYSRNHGTGKNNYTSLGLLANKPLKNFKHLMGSTGDLHSHETTKYHKESILKAQNFLGIYENPSLEIVNQIDSHRLKTIKENRNRLRPIIQSILFLSR